MPYSIEEVYPPELHSEMKAYEDVLNSTIESNSNEVIANFDENHGALMMTKLYEKTQHSFAIVAGDLNGKISNKKNYQEALTNCLEEKKVKARILLMDTPKEDSKAYQIILKNRDLRKNEIEIKFATSETVSYLNSAFENGGKKIHFAIFDENKFRIETSTETYSALGSFNNSERAKLLLKIFDEAFKTAKA